MQPYPQITLGQPSRQTELDGISVSEVSYTPGTNMPPHSHQNANVSLVIGGSFQETVDGETLKIGSCQLVLKPAGTVHSNEYGPDGAKAMVIEFFPETAAWQWFDEGSQGLCQWIQKGPCVAPAVHAYCQLQRSASEDRDGSIIDDVIELLACSRLDQGLLNQKFWRRCVKDARALLRGQFDQCIGSGEVAAALGVHPVYLARVFRQQLGCSMIEYRRRLQVGEAARRLADSRESVSSIAASCGFSDQSHLTRVFRSQIGFAPGQYRRVACG